MRMSFPRPGLVDLGILTVVVVALVLPSREMFAKPAVPGDDATQFGLALAEARTIAKPGDGLAVEDFGRRLGEANLKDWAIEETVHASERAKDSPTRWRALYAASVAYVDHIDVKEGLDFANRALEACAAARDKGDASACPTAEEIRMQLYQQALDAGVKSGKDPRHDPIGFRNAGLSGLRQIRIMGEPVQTPTPAGSGSGH
jgi:hypothetical protein